VIVTNPFSPESWTRAQIEKVSRGWWVLLITGIGSLAAGGVIIFTKWTVSDLVVFVGALLVFRGLFTAVSVPVDGSVRTWSIAMGLIEVAVGVAVWTWPGPTLLVLAAFIGWLLLFRGVMMIAGSLSARGVIPYWGLILAIGVLEVLVSFELLARPGLTLVAAVLAIGLVSMFYGVIQIIIAFEVKRLATRLDQAVGTLGGSTITHPLARAAQ
jgi:uncharacterized membrane protein HdeD (DUF308 family)